MIEPLFKARAAILRFWDRVAERRVQKLKRKITSSKKATAYCRIEHFLAWKLNQAKRRLNGANREDSRWDLSFECAHHLRKGLEEWWNSDQSGTRVVDWREGPTLCLIVGPNRIQAAAVLMGDYQAFTALSAGTVEKLLNQGFGLQVPSIHQIPINDGATLVIRVNDLPRYRPPSGGGKKRTPNLDTKLTRLAGEKGQP